MFRTLRAFLWMRWRTGRNAFRGKRNDTFETIARALAALTPIFAILMLVPTILVLAAGAGYLGYRMGLAEDATFWRGRPLNALRIVLGVLSVVLLIAPMVRSGRGSGSEMTRLMLLPIARSRLHLSEVVGGLGDPWLAVVTPALFAMGLGLFAGGDPLAGLVAVVAAALFVAVVGLAMSLASFTIALIFRKRQRAEWFTIGLIVVLSLSGIVVGTLDDWDEDGPRGLTIRTSRDGLPRALGFVPSELYTGMLSAGVAGESAAIAWSTLGLALWAAALYAGSRWTHSRLLETPETGSSRVGGRSALGFRAWPGVSPQVGAVAAAHLRLALRSVRGKTGVYLNFVVLALMYTALLRPRVELNPPPGVSFGMAICLAGTLLSLLSLQPILVNAFAVDGSGLTLQFTAPLSARDIVRGKYVAGAQLAAISMGLCLLTGALLEPSGSPLLWVATIAISAAGYLMFAPCALLLSILLPKHCDLSKMGKDGNPQPIASLAATVATPLLSVPGALIVLYAIVGEPSPVRVLALASFWLAVAAATSLLALRALPSLLERRRETLLLVAGGH